MKLLLSILLLLTSVSAYTQRQPKKNGFLKMVGNAVKKAAQDQANKMLAKDTVLSNGNNQGRTVEQRGVSTVDWNAGNQQSGVKTADWNTGNPNSGVKTVDWNTGSKQSGVKTVDWNTGNPQSGVKTVDWNTGNQNSGVKTVDWNTGNQNTGVKTVDWNTGNQNSGVKTVDWNSGNQNTGVKTVDWNTGNPQNGVKTVDWNTGNQNSGVKSVDWDAGNPQSGVTPVDWNQIDRQTEIRGVDMNSTPRGTVQPNERIASQSPFENVSHFADLNLGKIAQNEIYEKQYYPTIEKGVYFIIENTATWMIKREVLALTKPDKITVYVYKGINFLKDGYTLVKPYLKGQKHLKK